jgi:hypothetical protein
MKRIIAIALTALHLAVLGSYAQQSKDIVSIKVKYVNIEGQEKTGEIVCNKSIEKDLKEIFEALYEARYPIESIRPVSDYDGDDDRSMAANNTSCYNYRVMTGSTTKLSKHARGLAIDINPLYNPYVKGKTVKPGEGRKYAYNRTDKAHKGYPMITQRDLCYRLFKKHGFRWGGEWRTFKDYQHFEK